MIARVSDAPCIPAVLPVPSWPWHDIGTTARLTILAAMAATIHSNHRSQAGLTRIEADNITGYFSHKGS